MEGNPLFLEELAHMAMEQGDSPRMVGVPSTIQAILAARIDRLPQEAKRLLQMAAVIGKDVAVLSSKPSPGCPRRRSSAIWPTSRPQSCSTRRRVGLNRTLTFKHALTQEVAYNTMLLERRRGWHERAAQAIEALFARRLPEHYHALAHHYSRSGNTAQAVASMLAVLALAEQLAHPYSLTLALHWAAMLHQLRREVSLVQVRAEAAMTIATDQELPELFARTTPLRGWALAVSGHGEEGITQIQQSLAAYRATGATRDRPYYLALLAEASAQVGQTTEGPEALAEALATLAKSTARWCEAELYRLKGELLLAQESKRHKAQGQRLRKPRRVSTRRSRWPAASKRNRWSYEPRCT